MIEKKKRKREIIIERENRFQDILWLHFSFFKIRAHWRAE